MAEHSHPTERTDAAVDVITPSVITSEQIEAACKILGLPTLLVYDIQVGMHGVTVVLAKNVTANGAIITTPYGDGSDDRYIEKEVRFIRSDRLMR
jgi:hypothetical protein